MKPNQTQFRTEIPRIPIEEEHLTFIVKAKEKEGFGNSTKELSDVLPLGLVQKACNVLEKGKVVGGGGGGVKVVWGDSFRREIFKFGLI